MFLKIIYNIFYSVVMSITSQFDCMLIKFLLEPIFDRCINYVVSAYEFVYVYVWYECFKITKYHDTDL
jgi:hypothetical protein